jgi:hypothetical protein
VSSDPRPRRKSGEEWRTSALTARCRLSPGKVVGSQLLDNHSPGRYHAELLKAVQSRRLQSRRWATHSASRSAAGHRLRSARHRGTMPTHSIRRHQRRRPRLARRVAMQQRMEVCDYAVGGRCFFPGASTMPPLRPRVLLGAGPLSLLTATGGASAVMAQRICSSNSRTRASSFFSASPNRGTVRRPKCARRNPGEFEHRDDGGTNEVRDADSGQPSAREG